MKHHFIDYLDNGYFSFVPNRERWRHHFEDVADAGADTQIITVTKKDRNWTKLFRLSNLLELTLHEPSADQVAALTDLPMLTRLRITHARPKSLEAFANLDRLEELVLEYVSGIEDISPVGRLPNLRALHLESLRRMRDFSGLSIAKRLTYLSFDGTLDWSQTVENLQFIAELSSLEHLRICKVRVLDTECPLSAIADHSSLRKIELYPNAFPLEDFAWLEATRPDIDGAVTQAFRAFGGKQKEIVAPDVFATMPESELRSLNYGGIEIAEDGRRYRTMPFQAYLLGKGERIASGGQETVELKCNKHEARYRALVASFK